jgi:hypothetical protein
MFVSTPNAARLPLMRSTKKKYAAHAEQKISFRELIFCTGAKCCSPPLNRYLIPINNMPPQVRVCDSCLEEQTSSEYNI